MDRNEDVVKHRTLDLSNPEISEAYSRIAVLEKENQKLSIRLKDWIDAWYHQRDIIGDVWWWRLKITQAWRALQAVHDVTIKNLYLAARERDRLLFERTHRQRRIDELRRNILYWKGISSTRAWQEVDRFLDGEFPMKKYNVMFHTEEELEKEKTTPGYKAIATKHEKQIEAVNEMVADARRREGVIAQTFPKGSWVEVDETSSSQLL